MTSKKKKAAAKPLTKLKGLKPKKGPKARDNFPDVPDNHSPKLRHSRRRG